MSRRTVILVECREPNVEGDGVVCFVGSVWNTVDTFVSNPKNYGYSSDPDYFWWAQEHFVDVDDIRNTGRIRIYDKRGVLQEEMPE
jgi:hypothetical protein